MFVVVLAQCWSGQSVWSILFCFSLLYIQLSWCFYEYEPCHEIWASKVGERQLNSAFSDCCSAPVVSAGAVHYAVGRSSDGGLNHGGTNSMVYTAAGQGRITPNVTTTELCLLAMLEWCLSDCWNMWNGVIDGGQAVFLELHEAMRHHVFITWLSVFWYIDVCWINVRNMVDHNTKPNFNMQLLVHIL